MSGSKETGAVSVEKCPNCYTQMRQLRGGVGQLKVTGHNCDRCGYSERVRPNFRNDWTPDRAYSAGVSYASGYAD